MITFEVAVAQNQFLPSGETEIDAIVTVRARTDGAAAIPGQRAIVLIIDVSSSMGAVPDRQIAAKAAARAAVEALPAGTLFAVIAGNHQAEAVYPPTGLARADPETREAARSAIRRLRSQGGTAMDTWLTRAREVFDQHPEATIRQAVLLTDGYNESPREELEATVSHSEGHFRCDCRGIGVDWKAEDLLLISDRLQGTSLDAPTGSDLQRDFRGLVTAAADRAASAVRLQVWVPLGAHIRYVKQVAPTIQALTGVPDPDDPQTFDFPIGDWGNEQRDYQIGIGGLQDPDDDDGDASLAGCVTIVHGGPRSGGTSATATNTATATGGEIFALWTEDASSYSVVNREVARYAGLVGYGEAVRRGVAAYSEHDLALAAEHLGRAVQLAYEAGEQKRIDQLERGLLTVIDAAAGKVRIREDVSAHNLNINELRSRWTVPIG
ncbi:von Willebrand factor type A domain-containing protein [Parafrankia irregularis]|uniref:von Willebrand factor type A domain-containing protein n=1 Tax=Parafrankia irregularis TaxID=795642 RepID=A0A0S4QRM1_9ACTN|nr:MULTISPECIES: VWA domain-containing protein [Parafrankia]MBE3205991.1 VWA domain-containing protein [Parafrankia sp. CH37]CUU57130.1 von Willebrand factor type A domain-containing protein [Parafrankia irregularis]